MKKVHHAKRFTSELQKKRGLHIQKIEVNAYAPTCTKKKQEEEIPVNLSSSLKTAGPVHEK